MKKTPKPDEWLTRAQTAEKLGISPSLVSRYVRKGMPSRASDKKISREVAEEWYRANILRFRGGSFLHDFREGKLSPQAIAMLPKGAVESLPKTKLFTEEEHQARLDALAAITAPEEQERFARVALRLGCTPEQAYMLALWYASQQTIVLTDIGVDDLCDTGEPNWLRVLGKAVDFDALDDVYEMATNPEIMPGQRK
jgi:transcriptional regulator with XRE-family HTH domain